MSKEAKKLLLDIVNCPNFVNRTPVCDPITKLQTGSNRQVPEPWNGDIKKCKILFISSNPALDLEEKDFPTERDSKDYYIKFFMDRIDFTYKGIYIYKTNGKTKWVKFWAKMKEIADILLGRDALFCADYCVTEIVKCKSNKEQGVRKVINECMERWLDKVLDIAAADIFVVTGKNAKDAFNKRYGLNLKFNGKPIKAKIPANGKERIIYCVPHLSNWGKYAVNNSVFKQIPER